MPIPLASAGASPKTSVKFIGSGRRIGYSPPGSAAPSHFSEILFSSPFFFGGIDRAVTTAASSFGSFLFSPMKQGESLIRNLTSGFFGGLRRIAAATTLPVAIASTWPRKAEIVPLLSS